jgi:hypothetical protein
LRPAQMGAGQVPETSKVPQVDKEYADLNQMWSIP